jgi:hypothetical protein
MFKKISTKIISAATFALLIALPAKAAGILPPCADNGECQLPQILGMAVTVADWILGVVGAVALLFFVYGGFVFILSGGNEQNVKKGKDILIGSIIGLAIVFASYLIVQFAASLLGVKVGQGLWIKIK